MAAETRRHGCIFDRMYMCLNVGSMKWWPSVSLYLAIAKVWYKLFLHWNVDMQNVWYDLQVSFVVPLFNEISLAQSMPFSENIDYSKCILIAGVSSYYTFTLSPTLNMIHSKNIARYQCVLNYHCAASWTGSYYSVTILSSKNRRMKHWSFRTIERSERLEGAYYWWLDVVIGKKFLLIFRTTSWNS